MSSNANVTTSFFAGIEELASRAVGLVLTLAGFGVYILAKENLEINQNNVLLVFGSFWFLYEGLSYIFFLIFRYFTRRGQVEEVEDDLTNQ